MHSGFELPQLPIPLQIHVLSRNLKGCCSELRGGRFSEVRNCPLKRGNLLLEGFVKRGFTRIYLGSYCGWIIVFTIIIV